MKKSLLFALFGALALSLSVPAQAQQIFPGNGGTGFGGPVGTGSLSLSDDGTTLTGVFTRGVGDFNDALVIYIDSQAGGFTTTATFDDAGDPLRQAISGFNGTDRAIVDFATGFDADFAIAMDQGFAGLWELSGTGMHTFLESGSLTPTGTTQAEYTFTFTLANLGTTPVPFDFSSTYLNGGGAYRSNEALGNTLIGTPADMNGNFGQNTVEATFVTYVPEPSTMALAMIGTIALLGYRRRCS